MSKRVTIGGMREFSMRLRLEAMDNCERAHKITDTYGTQRQYVSARERGETLRRVANEIDAMLDGESK